MYLSMYVSNSLCIYAFIDNEVASNCVCLTLFNLSKIDNVACIANTSAIPLLVTIISENRYIHSTELAISTLCNLSFNECFYMQLGMYLCVYASMYLCIYLTSLSLCYVSMYLCIKMNLL
jgi:hypothetical protein